MHGYNLSTGTVEELKPKVKGQPGLQVLDYRACLRREEEEEENEEEEEGEDEGKEEKRDAATNSGIPRELSSSINAPSQKAVNTITLGLTH